MLPFTGLLTLSTCALMVVANHSVASNKRGPPDLERPTARELDERCAGPGCDAYPIDLSSGLPYVRFILASSDPYDGATGNMTKQETVFTIQNW